MAQDKLDVIRQRGALLVGVTGSSPPFCYRDDAGEIVGHDVDLAAEVAKRIGVPMRKVAILNKQRISALQDDTVDLVATGMSRSPAREREVDFSIDYLVSPHRVLVKTASGITRYRDLDGRSMALVHSASVVDHLKADLPGLRIVFYDDYTAAFAGLQKGEVDSFFSDGLLLMRYAHGSGRPQDYAILEDYSDGRTAGFAIKKGEARLVALANETLLALEADGGAQRIFDHWFAPQRRAYRISAETARSS